MGVCSIKCSIPSEFIILVAQNPPRGRWNWRKRWRTKHGCITEEIWRHISRQSVDRRCDGCTGVEVWDGHKRVNSRFEILSGMPEVFMKLGEKIMTVDFAE